ncbi:hypothetical protein C2G38_2203007 [Gigaspora rosea]|uniref:Uncharacterized protein n=1 Tax=Gigaspora rosea TaxID=44941 RepID=A0A397UQX3_9GLOM|nr:hypothetical protein C2G38_2203007 [Gigaspora rosea]
MDEDNTFEEIIDSIEPTSSGLISQNALEPGTLIVTNHYPKRVKKNPFWNELTEVKVELQNKVTQETKVEIYKAKLLNQRVDSKIVQTPKKEDPILVREKEISSLEASNIREKSTEKKKYHFEFTIWDLLEKTNKALV